MYLQMCKKVWGVVLSSRWVLNYMPQGEKPKKHELQGPYSPGIWKKHEAFICAMQKLMLSTVLGHPAC